MRAAASRVDDWNRFQRIVPRHRVTPLIYDGLARAGVELPEPTRSRLNAEVANCAVTALAMARESVRLQCRFDAAGLPVLMLKGSVVGMLAYGDPCLKESWDIDLLTTVEAVPKAAALLEKMGYELCEPHGVTRDELARLTRYGIEAGFRHRESGLTVELHWCLNRNPRLFAGVTADGPSQSVSVAGAELRTFGDETLFAYLCVHGAYHAWARLKWLADVNAFVGQRLDVIEGLVEAADRVGAGRAARSSLLLCRRLFGTPVPRTIARRAEADRSVRFLESVALRHINDRVAPGHDLALSYADILVSHLILAPGRRFLGEQVRIAWQEPIERLRYGRAADFLRIPLWLGRLARRLGVRLTHGIAGSPGD